MLQKRSFVRIWPDRSVAKLYNVHKIQSNISGNNVVLNLFCEKNHKVDHCGQFHKVKIPPVPPDRP